VSNSSDKIMIFIDGSNLLHSGMRNNLKIDILKLINLLTGDRNLRRVYYYASHKPGDKSKENFFKFLKENNILVRTLEARVRGQSVLEKGVDALIVIDVLTLGFNKAYDTAILISGDEDFCELIEAVKKYGPRVEIASFGDSLSPKLVTCADSVVYLNEVTDKIKM